MWMTIISFLGGPVISGLIKSYQAKLAAGNTSEKIAAELAATEIATQQAEIQAQINLKIAEIGHPWEPEKLAFYVTLVFYAKILLWDKVIGSFVGCAGHTAPGTCVSFQTDPVEGAAAIWAGLIMSFYFTKRGFENVARIIKR
jgi:hypothetical protein